ncbi:MAG: hypothetical protein LBB56_00200 [Chitinispirillales bacterium]|jgi:hypothetical protein|nr:hypothetical protein [Chitinispirillales bacterium]
MRKFDLYVTSLPDNKAKLIIARHIASLNASIPLQKAMSMVEKPPLLLFQGLILNEAEQHIARLKRSGIGFKVVESKITQEESGEIFQKTASSDEPPINYEEFADSQQSTVSSEKNVDIRDEADALKNLSGSDAPSVNHQKNIDTQNETPVIKNLSADNNATANQEKSGAKQTQKTTKTPANNITDDKKPESADNRKKTDKNDNNKKQPDKKSFAKQDTQNTAKVTQKNFQSGIRVSSIERAMQSEKKTGRKQTFIAMAVFIIAAVVLFFLPHEKKYAVKSEDAKASAKTNAKANVSINENYADNDRNKKAGAKKSASQKTAATENADSPKNSDSQSKARKEVSAQHKQQANDYVDSAKTTGADMESIVAFYKAAISFNPQNLAAWQGLLQAYRDLDKPADASRTEEQMRKIFGDRIESISLIVKPFGELTDTYINGDGAYRVEYKSNKRSKNDITRDVFLLTRAIRTVCSCEDISIYASTGTGKGLLCHSGQNTSVHSMSAFSSQAQIIWLD